MCLQKEILNLQKKFNYDIMNSSLARILRVKFFCSLVKALSVRIADCFLG